MYFPTATLTPTDSPMNTLTISAMNEDVAPTAATCIVPRKAPMTTMSAAL